MDDFESDGGRWNASSGSYRIAPDPAREVQGNVLEWRYNLIKNYILITTSARTERFAGAEEVAFRIRSDRRGRMFIRIDQANKSAFAKDFIVDDTWQEIRLKLSEIKYAGFGFRKIDASKIRTIYFVDLTGKDEGATGTRTVWLDDLRAIGTSGAGPTSTVSVASNVDEQREIDRVKDGLILRGYDAKGQVVTLDRLKTYGMSGGSHAFLSDLDHYPRPGVLGSSNGRGDGLPVLTAAQDDLVLINMLFWPIPGFGKMWVEADNAGAGYVLSKSKRKLVVNLNVELARSRLAKVEKYYASARQRAAGVSALQPRLEKLRAQLSRIRPPQTEREQAALADEALAEGMALGEALALEIARADLAVNRTGRAILTLTSATGAPVGGATVEFTQVRNDFTFGIVQSLGFADRQAPDAAMQRSARLAKDAGFNSFTASLFWDRIEPKQGNYQFDEWNRGIGLRHYQQAGLALRAHGMVQPSIPEHAKRAGRRGFVEKAVQYFQNAIPWYDKQFPGAFQVWEAANEPGSNGYVGLTIPERVDLLKRLSSTIRAAAPAAKVWINEVDWDRAQRFWPNANQHLRDLRSPLEFFELLNREQVRFDIAGLEWYPGLRMNYLGIIDMAEPMIDLLRTLEMLDRYQRLPQPLHVTEFALPGTSDPEWKNGYRGGNWTPESQARFAAEFYTVAFSRPHIREVTYWGLTDHEPWAIKGGLLDDNYTPKPVYRAVQSLLGSWRSSGMARTNSAGVVEFTGFAGDYTVVIRTRNGESRHSIHIPERETARSTVAVR